MINIVDTLSSPKLLFRVPSIRIKIAKPRRSRAQNRFMEKSVVRDIDLMKSSFQQNSSFTTTFNGGSFDLRRSKISNLPSHKKTDLSVKLPFVIVFQTIEIERLSEEVETLRMALKDSQKQAFNCQSYQIQIRELTDKCNEYDLSLNEYRDEIEKLSLVSQKLYDELEEWKVRYSQFDPLLNEKYKFKVQQCQKLETQTDKWKNRFKALEKSKDQELDDLKMAMENQRKSTIDRQIKQLNIKFDSERSHMQNQLRKIQGVLDNRQQQIVQCKYQLESLKIQNQSNSDATRKLKQTESKINRITQQLVRLNELLRKKQEEIERKDAEEQYLQQAVRILQKQKLAYQNQMLLISQLENNVKDWNIKYSRLQNQCLEYQEQLENLPLMQKQIQTYSFEIEKLSSSLKTKIQELTQSNNRADKMKSLYEDSKKSQQKVPALQRKITQMNYQTQRLADILKKRLIEIQDKKQNIISLQKIISIFEQSQPQRRRIEQENRKQSRQLQSNKKQIQQLQKKAKKLTQLEETILKSRRQIDQYHREIQKLNKTIKEINEHNQTLSQKINNLQNQLYQFNHIQQQINSYHHQNSNMVTQIDNLRNKISQKQQELDHIKNTVANFENNYAKFQQMEQNLICNIQNTSKIINQLNQTKEQLSIVQNQLSQCQIQLNEAKNIIIDINDQKQTIVKNLFKKQQMLEMTKNQNAQQSQQISQLRQIQRLHNILKQQMKITTENLKNIQSNLRKTKGQNEQLSYHKNQLTLQIQKIHQNGYFPQIFLHEFNKIKSSLFSKQKQIQKLKEMEQNMQKSTENIFEQIVQIYQQTNTNNGQWLEINQKIHDLANNINTISALQEENNQLRTLNLEIESQMKLIQIGDKQNQNRKIANSIRPAQSPQIQLQLQSQIQPQVQPQSPRVSVPASSWSFKTVPSKKAIDQAQCTSRVSTTSNQKQILITSVKANTDMASTASSGTKHQAEDYKSPAKTSLIFNQTNSVNGSNYQMEDILHQKGSIPLMATSPAKFLSKGSTVSRQSTQAYFSSKTTRTSSIREPYTFKNNFRA